MVMESSVQTYPGGRNITFEASGLNVGFCHQNCEEWFIKRRREIAQGSATFKSADQWYKALTYCKKDTKQLCSSMT